MIVLTAALALGFSLGMAVWGTAVVNRLLPHLGSRVRAEEAEFHIALVFLFAMAVAAQYSGVALVGAFLAGLIRSPFARGL